MMRCGAVMTGVPCMCILCLACLSWLHALLILFSDIAQHRSGQVLVPQGSSPLTCDTNICCVHLTHAAEDISSGTVSAKFWSRSCQNICAKLVKDVSTLCPVCCLWAFFCVSFIQYLVELVKYHRSPVPPSHMTYALLLTTRIALPPSGLHLVMKG